MEARQQQDSDQQQSQQQTTASYGGRSSNSSSGGGNNPHKKISIGSICDDPIQPPIKLEPSWDVFRMAVESRDYETVVTSALQLELAGPSEKNRLDETHYATYLFALLILFKLPQAKFLWERIPEQYRSEGSRPWQVWQVGKALWQCRYSDASLMLGAPGANGSAAAQSLAASSWSEALRPHASALLDAIVAQVIRTTRQAYAVITVQSLAERLGLPPESVIATVREQGWEVLDDGSAVVPKGVPLQTNVAFGMRQLTDLTNFVGVLQD
eukprot:Clim_evm21s154 gene=Clim_evmTU21s154